MLPASYQRRIQRDSLRTFFSPHKRRMVGTSHESDRFIPTKKKHEKKKSCHYYPESRMNFHFFFDKRKRGKAGAVFFLNFFFDASQSLSSQPRCLLLEFRYIDGLCRDKDLKRQSNMLPMTKGNNRKFICDVFLHQSRLASCSFGAVDSVACSFLLTAPAHLPPVRLKVSFFRARMCMCC